MAEARVSPLSPSRLGSRGGLGYKVDTRARARGRPVAVDRLPWRLYGLIRANIISQEDAQKNCRISPGRERGKPNSAAAAAARERRMARARMEKKERGTRAHERLWERMKMYEVVCKNNFGRFLARPVGICLHLFFLTILSRLFHENLNNFMECRR